MESNGVVFFESAGKDRDEMVDREQQHTNATNKRPTKSDDEDKEWTRASANKPTFSRIPTHLVGEDQTQLQLAVGGSLSVPTSSDSEGGSLSGEGTESRGESGGEHFWRGVRQSRRGPGGGGALTLCLALSVV